MRIGDNGIDLSAIINRNTRILGGNYSKIQIKIEKLCEAEYFRIFLNRRGFID